MKNDPLFPTTSAEYISNSDTMPTVGLYGGATMWDYYHAHAPEEIPHWFSFLKEPFDATVEDYRYYEPGFNESDSAELYAWHDLGSDVSPHLIWYTSDQEKKYKEKAEQKMKHEAAYYFKWRSYYATMMLEQRNANLPK